MHKRISFGATAGLGALTMASALSPTTSFAVPVPGGTLDPLTIPKYVTPLVIPPVLYDDKGGKKPLDVDVALRQITQQVLPAGFPATPLWAYGNPDNPKSFNNPAFTFEVTKDTMSTVTWINQLVVDPEKCFDDDDDDDHKGKGRHDDDDDDDDDDDHHSKGKGKHNKQAKGKGKGKGNGGNRTACNFLPHIIQDANGNPLIDQTLHWAAPNQDCRDGITRTDCRGASDQPYDGPVPMVTHVHGAHVNPVSDGYPEAWWLPDARDIPAGYATTGTFYDTTVPAAPGSAVFSYTNDQPTTTLWYHDHSLGMTRVNVYAASAGFWLIRTEKDLETGKVKGKLPGPAPKLGQDPNNKRWIRGKIREIPLAIQPKSFNADGTQFYPANRAFFEGLGDGQTFDQNASSGLNIPFLPQSTSDIAPVWNPEAFFNTMVVNGSTWPQLDVASERYRFRVLNAADSRFLNLALFEVVDAGADGVMGTADDTLGAEIPFYQIGSEQGLLPDVVRIETGFATRLPGNGQDVPAIPAVPGTFAEQALLVGPAERADVIVDFTGLANGSIVRMINTAPDAPFGGIFTPAADLDTTGQVMQFVVNTRLNRRKDRSSPPARLVLNSDRPGGARRLGAASALQDLALLEEESALICVEITPTSITQVAGTPPNCPAGSEPFAPKAALLGVNGSGGGLAQMWDDPIAQNPAIDSVEEWDLWNHSADAHPIHLHLVKFEVIERECFDAAACPLTVLGTRPAEPWEAGWKDTVIAYPGERTRIKALFDIPGLYVWHCHILSHEDNEMMVPYCVGTPGVDCPAELFAP